MNLPYKASQALDAVTIRDMSSISQLPPKSEPPLAMARLKQATGPAHQRLESLAMPGDLSTTLTSCRYARLIRHNYLLHLALEPELADYLDLTLPELAYGSQRCKLTALRTDLQLLEQQTPQAEFCLPALRSLPQALGRAYVLEGASLGGQLIFRALMAQPALAELGAVHFYGFYGTEIGLRWKQFSNLLNASVVELQAIDEACEAACQVFKLACEIFAQAD